MIVTETGFEGTNERDSRMAKEVLFLVEEADEGGYTRQTLLEALFGR
jgi:hypothetical protein